MSSIVDLPTSTLINILSNLPWIELISTITKVNKYLRILVKTEEWENQKIIINSTRIANKIIKNYKFVNYEFNCELTDDMFDYLVHCEKLSFQSLRGISEESLKSLSRCKKIKVTEYVSLEDPSFEFVNQRYLTHFGFKKMFLWEYFFGKSTLCESLSLYKCRNVVGLNQLVNCKKIKLVDCEGDINDMLRQLIENKNLTQVIIFNNDPKALEFDDDVMEYLSGLQHVSLNGLIKITTKLLNYLVKCPSLNLSECCVEYEEMQLTITDRYSKMDDCVGLLDGLGYLEFDGEVEIINSDEEKYRFLRTYGPEDWEEGGWVYNISLRYSSLVN